MLTSICMFILALAAVRAVFSDGFDDSFPQRVALSGLCISALALAWWSWGRDVPAPVEWYAVAQAGFTLASIFKGRA